MYPEVRTYLDAVTAARNTHDKDRSDLQSRRSEYETQGTPCTGCGSSHSGVISGEYYEKQRDILATYNARKSAAWLALKDTSADPLVGFIVDNCGEWKDQALLILSALPASVEELCRIADDGEWCSVWDGFLARARNAGVLPGSVLLSPERVELLY